MKTIYLMTDKGPAQRVENDDGSTVRVGPHDANYETAKEISEAQYHEVFRQLAERDEAIRREEGQRNRELEQAKAEENRKKAENVYQRLLGSGLPNDVALTLAQQVDPTFNRDEDAIATEQALPKKRK